jgi:hypothetical protein
MTGSIKMNGHLVQFDRSTTPGLGMANEPWAYVDERSERVRIRADLQVQRPRKSDER